MNFIPVPIPIITNNIVNIRKTPTTNIISLVTNSAFQTPRGRYPGYGLIDRPYSLGLLINMIVIRLINYLCF